ATLVIPVSVTGSLGSLVDGSSRDEQTTELASRRHGVDPCPSEYVVIVHGVGRHTHSEGVPRVHVRCVGYGLKIPSSQTLVTGDLQGLVNAFLKALEGVLAGPRALDGFWETCIRFSRLVNPACQVFLTTSGLNDFRENGLSEVSDGLRCDRET